MHNSELYLWDFVFLSPHPNPHIFLVMDGQTDEVIEGFMVWKPTEMR